MSSDLKGGGGYICRGLPGVEGGGRGVEAIVFGFLLKHTLSSLYRCEVHFVCPVYLVSGSEIFVCGLCFYIMPLSILVGAGAPGGSPCQPEGGGEGGAGTQAERVRGEEGGGGEVVEGGGGGGEREEGEEEEGEGGEGS